MRPAVLPLLAALLLAASGLVAAQTATDGSRPSDGAIKGDSIVPGESGGMPESGRSGESAERLKRCNELSGSLREDCVRKEQESSVGSTGAPDKGGARTTPERDAPPPQNPR